MKGKGERRMISIRKAILVGLCSLMLVAGGVIGGQLLVKAPNPLTAQAQTRSAASAGEPSNTWYFAEGCTYPGVKTYLSIFNHHASTNLRASIRLCGSNGWLIPFYTKVVPANRRVTVDINAVAASCYYVGDVSIQVIGYDDADGFTPLSFYCERPMYASIGYQVGGTSWGYNY